MAALMPTYARLPVTFSHGQGCYLVDTEGRRYFDALCGISVTNLGHAHPGVTAAIAEQSAQLLHTSNLYHIGAQEKLADRLTALAGMDKVFFCNSGAEANEAAIKLARLYGSQKDIQRPAIIVLEDAFHGRTLATLSATGNRKIQAGFEPLVSGFIRAPRDDLEAVRQIAASNPDVVAILAEPIQGEGGIQPLAQDYLLGLRDICDQQDWLLMLDEVQSGNGRTGSYFAYQGLGVVPDVVSTAKGLGNGVPIGACLARGKAAEVFSPGTHGTTYGGNPLACAAALAVIEAIEADQLCANATARGAQIVETLQAELVESEMVVDIRGRGLMLGIELARDCGELASTALEAGLLINVTAGNTIRLLPPLIISEEEARDLGSRLATLINAFA